MPYADPEKRRAYHREYSKRHYQANRERYLSRPRDLEAAREQSRRYYADHREVVIDRIDRWRSENRDVVREHARKSARKRRARIAGVSADTSGWTDEYADLVRLDPCSYCGGPGGAADHISPIAGNGADHWSNLTGACKSCNSSKGTKTLVEFLCR